MYMIIVEFIKWLETMNYAEKTVKNYIKTLEVFDDDCFIINTNKNDESIKQWLF